MKVKDLIKQLQEMDGECQVRVIADHGQTLMQAEGAEYSYLLNEDIDEYMPENEYHEDDLIDLEEYSKKDFTRIVVVYSN